MIGWLQGNIIDKQQPGKLVLAVNGVGYDVETSLQTFFRIESHPNPLALHIHTIVREDAFLLYGFFEQQERALFRALIKVNGVGPKVAMTILSSITPSEFVQCIQQQNASQLSKLPGIGKKTAERLIIEMKDSLAHFSTLDTAAIQANPKAQGNMIRGEAISALEALGFKQQEAIRIINKIDDGNKSCEQLIREGLQLLAVKA